MKQDSSLRFFAYVVRLKLTTLASNSALIKADGNKLLLELDLLLKVCSDSTLTKLLKTFGQIVTEGENKASQSLKSERKVVKGKVTRFSLEFSRRQKEVAVKVSEGLSNKIIAAQLGISEQTVKNHLGIAFDKIGGSNRVDLTRHVLENPANFALKRIS